MTQYTGIIAAKPERTDATTDPTASDDFTGGWASGSEWLNQSTGVLWKCFSAARGAAVWRPIQASDGDGSGVTVRAPAAPYARRLADIASDRAVNVLSYIPPAEHAAIFAGTSTFDASAALNAIMIDGRDALIPYNVKIYCANHVVGHPGTSIYGELVPGAVTYDKSYYDLGSQIKLKAGATVYLHSRAALKNVLVIREGLPQPASTAAIALTIPGAFSGTGVMFLGDDCRVEDCLLLGHETAIDTYGRARAQVTNTLIDATNGVHVSGGWDICRLERVHVWPFMTAITPGVAGGDATTAPALRRGGFGFKVSDLNGGGADWSTLVDCFEYGHADGFWLHNCSNVSLIRPQCDYTSINTGALTGIKVTGTSIYTTILNPTVIGPATSILVDTTGGSLADNGVRILGGVFAAPVPGAAINVVNGAAVIHGNQFYSGEKGIVLGAGADPGSIIGNYFQGVQDPLVVDAVPLAFTEILGNTFHDVTETLDNRMNRSVMVAAGSGKVTVADTRPFTEQGFGGALALSADFGQGVLEAAGLRASVVAGSGNEAAGLILSTRRLGSLVDRWRVDHEGYLLPSADNVYDVGAASLRLRNIYAGNGSINTSDRDLKTDVASPDDALLDAWGGVSWCLYRFRDAVAQKGDAARIHAGAIAQEVHAALAAHGIDGFRYGLLCRDDLTEPTGELDGSVRVIGERWGLRYDQCLVVEAAYQRRRCDRLEARLSALEGK